MNFSDVLADEAVRMGLAIRIGLAHGWLTTDEARWLSAGLLPLSQVPALRIRLLTAAELEG